MFSAPAALGRSVVVAPGGVVPGLWAGADRVVVDDRTLRSPGAVLERLHHAWVGRRPVAIELACDQRALRVADCVGGPVYGLDPSFEFPLERLHFLVWANSYDARTDELVWWHARKAAKRLPGVREMGPADVVGPDGSALFIDGGPPDPPALPTGTAVAHRWNVEEGSLVPAGHRPPAADLAPDQLAAVAHGAGGARVIAPAGSGKTRVLTERLRHLVVDRHVHRSTVTAVAYNREAAAEMRARCRDVVGPDGKDTIRTLNSLGLWICHTYGGQGQLGLAEDVRPLVEAHFPVPHIANTDTVTPYVAALSAVRLGLQTPEAVEAASGDVSGLAEGFDAYRAALSERGQLDFDEQIYRAIEILVRDAAARMSAQRRCRRLLVDEFQDLHPAHLLLLRLLSAPGYDCFGVGDDDQVIYGYSGASPAFLVHFDRYFPGSGHHALEVNYRSPPTVVTAARHLLSYNYERVDKTITTPSTRSDPSPLAAPPLAGVGAVAVVEAPGEELTARCVEVLQAWRSAGVADSDIAVLTRVNSALLPVQIACISAGIPVTCRLTPAVLRRTGMRTALAYLRIGCRPSAITRADVSDTIHRPPRRIARNVAEMLTKRPSSSVADIRRLAASLSGSDVSKLRSYADELEAVAVACRVSTRAALRAVRLDVGLGESMDVLDSSRGEADRSTHADDLLALESVAALHPDAASFEQWLHEMLAKDEPQGPVVLLSTVHKIKGKEWPRVAVFGVTNGLFPHRLGADTEGERRVFHVAITRARTQVAVLADADTPSPFLAELDGSATPTRARTLVEAASERRERSRPPRRTASVPLSGRTKVNREHGAVAAVGLQFEHGGHRATVVEAAADGALVRVGEMRLTVAYGTPVRVDGRTVTLEAPPASAEGGDGPAAAALRAWRVVTAKAEKVPAYVVLNDRDLLGIAERRPSTLAELARCRGMGPIRLERYGDEILAAIEPWAQEGVER